LSDIGLHIGGQTIVKLFTDRREYDAELIAGNPAVCPIGREPKIFEEVWLQF
jgi:hypothetical protein